MIKSFDMKVLIKTLLNSFSIYYEILHIWLSIIKNFAEQIMGIFSTAKICVDLQENKVKINKQ